MKGFLRRILENARGAEQRVKPLAGSVYAGDRRRKDPWAPAWREESAYVTPGPIQTVPTRAPSQPEAAQAASPSAPQTLLPAKSQPHERPATNNAQSRGKGASPARGNATTPGLLAAHPDPLRLIRSPSQKHLGQNIAPLIEPKPQRNAPPPAPDRNGPLQTEERDSKGQKEFALAEKGYPPAQPPRVETTKRIEPLLRPGLATKGGGAPQHPLAKSRVAQEPPVQIHIARVEVIAAAPELSRTPTPRPNRATSLADYLAGRNGRSS
jgi:hypothetical protein